MFSNECTNCNYKWFDLPGGFGQHQKCPKCGSLYWISKDLAKKAKTGDLKLD